MWQVANSTPFPAHGGFFRDHGNGHCWGLWIKAGFALRPGRPPLFLPDQPQLNTGPVPASEIANSISGDNDILPPKPQIDLIVTARAMQPDEGNPRDIALGLGAWRKELSLHPPLRWNWRGRAVVDRDAVPALVTFDGRDSFGGDGNGANPIGRGGDTESSQEIPALSYRSDPPKRRGDPIQPAMLGPISPDWGIRRCLAGTYDEEWRRSRAPLTPLDFDPLFLQSAPVDQRLERPIDPTLQLIAGGCEGVGPAERPTSYPLGQLDLSCASRIAGVWHPADPQLQTIHVDLVRNHLCLTYLAVWPLANSAADIDVDLTKLALNSTDSFRVSASDAHLFAQPLSESLS